MSAKYYLAVDIGASSGRLILAHMEQGKMVLEEVYRFRNGSDSVTHGSNFVNDGSNSVNIESKTAEAADVRNASGRACLVWNTQRLLREILTGMKKCAGLGKIPVSMGIDTWGVDYVLLDKDDRLLGPAFAYRDNRTQGMDEKVYEIIPEEELYKRTGIQKASFNTIYQLMADRLQNPERLESAESLLMIPDYLHFLLTGVKKQEYTNATTSGLVNASSCEWDMELIRKLGFPEKLFTPLSMPGSVVGPLRQEIADEVGFTCSVVLPATHDTGSAVMSVPSDAEDTLYISSGTWSLFGCERTEADTSSRAEKANFTNEGGYAHRFRFLKNIMGLWMIQSVQKEFLAGYSFEGMTGAEDYGFASLCAHAAQEEIASLVPANDPRFLAPESMVSEVQAACRESGQEVPVTPWQISRVIYRSLAACYKTALTQIEEITGRRYDTIHIVGGGSQAEWLNQLTAEETGRIVMAGPGEATAIGNLGSQMIADGVFPDLPEFRHCVRDSFHVKKYTGQN